MDLYFKRHDGQAVSCEDFWGAMYDANIDTYEPSIQETFDKYMTAVSKWYFQPGTPIVHIEYSFDEDNAVFKIKCSQTNQRCIELRGCYEPVMIPIRVGLIDPLRGNELYNGVLFFCDSEKEFTIDVSTECIPSFMRDFSAPVIVEYNMPLADRLFLMNTDSNMFNRWEQSQIIHKDAILKAYDSGKIDASYINVLVTIALNESIDPNLKSLLLTLPSHHEMITKIKECDPVKLYEQVILRIYRKVSHKTKKYLIKKTDEFVSAPHSVEYELNNKQISDRELFKTLLKLRLVKFDSTTLVFVQKLKDFFTNSDNLTDRVSVIQALGSAEDPTGEIAQTLDDLLEHMAARYVGDSVMTSKWLRYIANIPKPNTVNTLSSLFKGSHKRSDMISKTTPNHMYSMVFAFTCNPYVHHIIELNDETKTLHAPGYKYIRDCILDIDPNNGIVSSSIAEMYETIKDVTPAHRILMQSDIDKIKATPNLSENIKEVLH